MIDFYFVSVIAWAVAAATTHDWLTAGHYWHHYRVIVPSRLCAVPIIQVTRGRLVTLQSLINCGYKKPCGRAKSTMCVGACGLGVALAWLACGPVDVRMWGGRALDAGDH